MLVYWIYNLLFPLVFPFFVPGLLVKLWRRPGHKRTFLERFAVFAPTARARLAACRGGVWIHAVSVGETVAALALLREWRRRDPGRRFVISTTTTTGQELARRSAPADVAVIFCPIDFVWFVRKTARLVEPELLLVFETELWPNMLREVRASGGKVVLANARMSDKSYRGYHRFRRFFRPVLENFHLVCAQSETDAERFRSVAPGVPVEVCGNLKFDQLPPDNVPDVDLDAAFGGDTRLVLLAASTHPGEERLVADIFARLRGGHPELRLVLVPRHAERGGEVSRELRDLGIPHLRRSTGAVVPAGHEGMPACLLADTTGEMAGFLAAADLVLMGKSFAGHDEGHNIIEPALFGKPIITGAVMRNFRYALQAMAIENAVATASSDAELAERLTALIDNPETRRALGERAAAVVARNRGASERTINLIERLK